MNKTVRGRVGGRVQGVGFRAATRRRAEDLGLGGWVRNGADGSVEFAAHGDAERLEVLLSWLHHGPPGAHVTAVEVDEARSEIQEMPEGRRPVSSHPRFEIRW